MPFSASESDKSLPGCVFAPRCPRVINGLCHDTAPPWQSVLGRRYLCHHDPAILSRTAPRKVRDQYLTDFFPGHYEWPALLRELDRDGSSYAD
ncbi:MAG: hypothetical protein E6Q98_12590 [Rhodospirillaceae bacterium]|nr:MAG: hypothetical protein E6Q98_12590 [Rhodospirillaceae bacterium]